MIESRVRIGRLFTAISCIVYAMRVIASLSMGRPLLSLLNWENILILVSAILFLSTTQFSLRYAIAVQTGMVGLCAIVSLITGPITPFYGLSLTILAVLLAYSYGLFAKYPKTKAFAGSCFLYIVFVLFPLKDMPTKYITALSWIFFIDAFLFCVMIFFKDSLEKLEDKEIQTHYKLIRLLEESREATDNAVRIGKAAIKELKRVGGVQHGQ